MAGTPLAILLICPLSFPGLLSQRHHKRTDHNAKIRQIKYNPRNLLVFHRKADVIHHIFTYQTVIGIAVCSAKKKGQTSFERFSSPIGEGSKKNHRQKERQK